MKAFVSGFCFGGFVLDWVFLIIEVYYEMIYSYNEKTVDLKREKNRKKHRSSKILSQQVGRELVLGVLGVDGAVGSCG